MEGSEKIVEGKKWRCLKVLSGTMEKNRRHEKRKCEVRRLMHTVFVQ